jgi:splicing factor 3B subunit 5
MSRKQKTSNFDMNSQMDHIRSKYQGAGHADTSKFEWIQEQHRDTLASYVSHPSLTNYFSLAENQSIARTKYDMLTKIVQPCGPSPKTTTNTTSSQSS